MLNPAIIVISVTCIAVNSPVAHCSVASEKRGDPTVPGASFIVERGYGIRNSLSTSKVGNATLDGAIGPDSKRKSVFMESRNDEPSSAASYLKVLLEEEKSTCGKKPREIVRKTMKRIVEFSVEHHV